MKAVDLKIEWICDQCRSKKVIQLDHEPNPFKNGYPFELPKGWFRTLKTSPTKHYCSEECLWKAHPESRDSFWMT